MEKAQEKIQKLEIYKEIFLNSSDPIEMFDPNGFYLEQNLAFRAMTGYSEHELQGKSPAIHLGKKVFPRILRELSQKGKYQGTLISQPKMGPRRHLELSAFPIHDHKAEVTGYIAVSRDITKRTQAKEALRETDENYRSLVENIGLFITRMDSDYNIIMANSALEKILNKPFAEIAGKKCYREFEKRDSICDHCPGRKAMAAGVPQAVETEGVRDDDTRFQVYIRAFPSFGPDGIPNGFIEVGEDISQRKKQDEKLQKLSRELAESRILLSNVLEYSTEFSITATDLNFKILLYNKKAEEMYGYTAAEVIGRSVKEIHTKGKVSRKRFLWAVKTVLEKGKYEYHITRKTDEGKERIYHSVVFPMRNRQKKHCGYVVFSHDVTEQKQAEEELKQREIYLSMIAEIGQRLLSGTVEDWKFFTPILKLLGETAEADRVYIFKNYRDHEGDLLCSQLYEWTAEGIESHLESQVLQNFSYRKMNFSRWVKIMSGHGLINGLVNSFPEAEREFLNKQKIKSLLAVPIFIDKEWWGFLGLDDCKSERKWNKVEETLLQTVATTLGGFFKRLEEEKRISQSLKEKEVLLREIHHRVKNNLQIVSSLLHLQARQVKEQPYREMFLSSQSRVKTMSLIHQKLCQAADLSSINIGSFIEDLTKNLFRAYQEKSKKITLEVSAEELDWGVDLAVPCGLIITELVSNSLKHAFPNNRRGKIKINLSKTNQEYLISISDNGVGIPAGTDPLSPKTLGLLLVVSLVRGQLNGRIELVLGHGTTFNIRVK